MKIDELSPLETAQQVAAIVSSVSSSSLTEYTAPTRLNPILLIDKRVLALEPKQLNALEQTMLSIYCGYYLLSVNLAMNVGNVKVMRILDQFSTDRSILGAAGNSSWLSSSKFGGYTTEEIDDTAISLPKYSLESASTLFPKSHFEKLKGGSKSVDNDKTIHNITDESNLVVGKLLDVKLVSGDHSTTVPVNVTLSPKSIEPEDILEIARYNSIDKSQHWRYHQWKAGEIRYIKDYLLSQDLIEADRKAILADKTGTLLNNRSKRTKGIIASLLSGYASPNVVSAMFFISKQTAEDLELIIKGSLKNTHVREQYFSSNSAMLLVVVDLRRETFTLYQRGIADYSEHTLEDIKGNASKPNGTSIQDILSAYKLGSAAMI